MNFENKRVLVVGFGKSGIASTNLLIKKGANVVLYDGKKDFDLSNITEDTFPYGKPKFSLGNVEESVMKDIELAVFSPGVPLDIALAEECRKLNIPIWGEIELAFQFEQGLIVGITGTNGKTTTTTLVGDIMRTTYPDTFVVGNIGEPYTNQVLNTSKQSVTVAEISSFQLETVHDFHPRISAILNITPDHLNRHKTMENYAAAKGEITKNQTSEDVCILNFEDSYSEQFAKNTSATVVYFSSKRELDEGFFLNQKNEIVCRKDNTDTVICNIDELQILGTHSYENAMAAIAMGMAMNVPLHKIREALLAFKAVEHRIEYVTEKSGVKYYNDSKGTNVDAAIKAIQAMVRPTILIGGGYDKASEYDEWIQAFDGKVKYFVLLGKTKYKIEETARKYGFTDIILVDTLEEAVEKSSELAVDGDAVLLSPACASWDMFSCFEERGNLFKEYVNQL